MPPSELPSISVIPSAPVLPDASARIFRFCPVPRLLISKTTRFLAKTTHPKECSNNGAIKSPLRYTVKLHFRSMKKKKQKRRQNIVGAQVRKLRYAQGLTQELFAARCSVLGLELSRATLSKIEAQLRCVNDLEVALLARALKVNMAKLFPPGMLD
jgi:hypothetical protein